MLHMCKISGSTFGRDTPQTDTGNCSSDMYNYDMKTAESILPVRWMQVLCILAGLYAVAVALYIFIETGKSLGSRDFHQFWYAGHFIIQGRDPYEAFFAGEPPALPIAYVDGVTINRYPVAQADLEITPSNTPMMLLLLSSFSFFSWHLAKWMFVVVNLILMLVTGWLVIRHFPFRRIKLSPIDEVLIFLVYFDLSATRIAIENGQTTLLVFLLMILALLYAERSWGIAGLALGIALSKYSLSLPVFIFLLYKRNFKVLLAAITVQLLGVLGVTLVTGNSPFTIIFENIQLFFRLFDQPGIHLSRWFEFLSDNHFVSMIPVLVMTLFVFVPILFWLRNWTPFDSEEERVLDFHLLTILFIWTLLVAYHRLYDTLIVIFFVVLVFKGLARPNLWKLTEKERTGLLVFMATIPALLILPARIVGRVLPNYYGKHSDFVTTCLLVLMLGFSMILFRRFVETAQPQTIGEEIESYDLRTDPQ